ncbi:MAG: hypothetical protein ABSG56_23660 [Bryobacteraceae bacterium]
MACYNELFLDCLKPFLIPGWQLNYVSAGRCQIAFAADCERLSLTPGLELRPRQHPFVNTTVCVVCDAFEQQACLGSQSSMNVFRFSPGSVNVASSAGRSTDRNLAVAGLPDDWEDAFEEDAEPMRTALFR